MKRRIRRAWHVLRGRPIIYGNAFAPGTALSIVDTPNARVEGNTIAGISTLR